MILLCLLTVLDYEKISSHPEKPTGFRSVLPPAVGIPCGGSDVLHKQLPVTLSQTICSTKYVCLFCLPAMMVLQDCFLSSNHTLADFSGDSKVDDNVCVSIKRKRCLFLLLLLPGASPGPENIWGLAHSGGGTTVAFFTATLPTRTHTVHPQLLQ